MVEKRRGCRNKGQPRSGGQPFFCLQLRPPGFKPSKVHCLAFGCLHIGFQSVAMTGWAQAVLFETKTRATRSGSRRCDRFEGFAERDRTLGPRAEAQHPGKLRPAQEPKAPRAAGHASLCGSLPLFCGEKGERLFGVSPRLRRIQLHRL